MDKVELLLQRMDHTNKSTYGVLFSHLQNQIAFVIEDTYREVKVQSETRIPSGCYQIKFREVWSPMTEKYRNKFSWFSWHLELQDVPNFTYCYLHIGNSAKDSSGCGLVNKGVRLLNDEYIGIDSTSCFEEVYLYIADLLEDGVEVFIRIQDEEYFKQPF